jgi:hypothetical protein
MPRTRQPKRPASLAVVAANRANAALSTGPRTPEGKAISARNAVRLEDLQEVAHLKRDLIAVYHPVNSQELFALERMAAAQQTIRRAARLESGLFTTCLNETFNIANDEPFILTERFHRLSQQSNSWSLFLRYQAQAERLYRRPCA